MGDRAHIHVIQGEGGQGIFLYTHWGGYKIKDDIKRALRRGSDRWTDPEYFARILFDAMKGDDVESTTGFGISAWQPDGFQVVVDIPLQIVIDDTGSYSFNEYMFKPNSFKNGGGF
jgi:hypothetical protein